MWSSGDVIVRREMLHGRPWTGMTVRVVDDRDDLLVIYTPEGTPFGFPEHPYGPHPWHAKSAWHGHGVLQLLRAGDAYSVLAFWRGSAREFAGWYVNFQDPFRRTAIGIDTLDHVLDIWIPSGRQWEWKDVGLLEQSVAEGRFTPAEAAAIRAEGERVARELDAGRRWWSDEWATWEPPADWTPQPLPPGWDEVR